MQTAPATVGAPPQLDKRLFWMPPPRISTEAMADSHMYLARDECALIVLMGIIFSISSEDWQMVAAGNSVSCLFGLLVFYSSFCHMGFLCRTQ
jgi:hypothetical protein